MKIRIILAFLLVLISLQLVNAKLENRYETENMLVEFNFTDYEDCKQNNNWVSLTDNIRVKLKRGGGSTHGSCKGIVYFVELLDRDIRDDFNVRLDSRSNLYCFDGTIERFLYRVLNEWQNQITNDLEGNYNISIKLENQLYGANFIENIPFNFKVLNKNEIEEDCREKTKRIWVIGITSIVIFLTLVISVLTNLVWKTRSKRVRTFRIIIEFLIIVLEFIAGVLIQLML